MSNPSPLIPQGTFQAQANKGASNVRIAVATIVAIHVVFFGGLLLQGCKRDTKTGSGADTNSLTSSNLSLPPIETSSYYSNAASLPAETSAGLYTTSNTAGSDYGAQGNASTVRDTLAPSGFNTGVGITPPPADMKEYTVVRGDTYAKIAAAHRTTVTAMKKANPAIDPAKLRPGMKVQVPEGVSPGAVARVGNGVISPNGAALEAMGAAGGSGMTYTVKAGDTLTKIAKMNNVTVTQLRAVNSLRTSGLKVGQKIKIPAPSPGGGELARHTNLTVKPGARKPSTNSNSL